MLHNYHVSVFVSARQSTSAPGLFFGRKHLNSVSVDTIFTSVLSGNSLFDTRLWQFSSSFTYFNSLEVKLHSFHKQLLNYVACNLS